ncbi:transmembrane 7 superfamily member 3-like isoform X2 [Porites lutea]|uniref:transmembrane 7 superfamily member 3-like isoform X2 n=1 Tax=Porites lutea TaxID=51062 RepID=UPI003CC58726
MIRGEGHALVVIILQIAVELTQNVAVISAENFELQPNRGERRELQPFEHLDLMFCKAEAAWRFVIYQVHAQQNNVTLSLKPGTPYGFTVTGSNVAALFPFKIRNPWNRTYHLYLKSENNHSTYKTDIMAVPYEDKVPFPGGCCLTCAMEFDPNIVVSHDSVETNITFSFANVYYGRSGKKGSSLAPPCDGNKVKGKPPEHFRLEYYVYLMFLPEGDVSEKSFFQGVEEMAYPARIKNHGQKVSTLKAPTIPVLKFLTYPVGQGVVFNVIVYDPDTKKEAAYSPVASYACVGCHQHIVAVDAVFAVIGSILGLIFCFFGLYLFKFTLFVGGLVNFAFLFFIIISATSTISHLGCMLMSAGLGLLFGLLIFALWWFTGWTRLCLVFDALFLGFLVGATLMFTPFGIDFFLHTSLSYIVVDVILHATKPQFRKDHIVVTRPFQQNDYILSATWLLLAVLGVFVQAILAKIYKMQLPKSGFIQQSKVRRQLKKQTKSNSTETTPILINSGKLEGYGTNNGIC